MKLQRLGSLPVLLAYLAGLVGSLYLPPSVALAAAGSCIASVLAFMRLRCRQLSWQSFLLIAVFCCLGWVLGWTRQQDLSFDRSQTFHNRYVSAEMTLLDLPRLKGDKAIFRGELEALQESQRRWHIGEAVEVELFCHESCQDSLVPTLDEGSRIRVQGRLKPIPSDPQDDFDYGAYLRQRGINSILTVGIEQLQVLPERRGGPMGLVDALRRHARASLQLGDWGAASSLLAGMVLGDADRVPEQVVNDFRDAGLLHLMAVSGQNVVLLGLVALFLGRLLRLPRLVATVMAAVFISIYIPLTGAGPSIVRAGVVGILALVAWVLSRPPDRYRFLVLAAAVIMSWNPYSFWDPGFQLSFASVLAIFWLVPPLIARLQMLPPLIKEAVAVSVAAALATAPISLAHFGQLPLAGIPANIAAAPAAAPVMLLGTLAILVAPLSAAAAWLLDAVASLCTAFLIEIAAASAALPGAVFYGESPGLYFSGLYYGLLALLPLLLRKVSWGSLGERLSWRRYWLVGVALVAVLSVAVTNTFACRGTAEPADFTASFFDVGQGDAALIQVPGGATVLIDGGPGPRIVDWLKENGVEEIDAVIASHGDADHMEGLVAVIEHFQVAAVFDSGPSDSRPLYRRFRETAAAKGTAYRGLKQRQQLDFGELSLRVFGPRDGAVVNSNEGSLVLTASYHGLDILYPGDAEGESLTGLELPEVEVLKVSHHGSEDGYLGQLLEQIDPLLAVISVGRGNTYGHPAAATLAQLNRSGAEVLRTDQRGTIRLTLNEQGIEVGTEH